MKTTRIIPLLAIVVALSGCAALTPGKLTPAQRQAWLDGMAQKQLRTEQLKRAVKGP